MWPKACDRWGQVGGLDRDDPACKCGMCRARRFDKLTAKERKKHPEMRP